jgi:hypothetical protein
MPNLVHDSHSNHNALTRLALFTGSCESQRVVWQERVIPGQTTSL